MSTIFTLVGIVAWIAIGVIIAFTLFGGSGK